MLPLAPSQLWNIFENFQSFSCIFFFKLATASPSAHTSKTYYKYGKIFQHFPTTAQPTCWTRHPILCPSTRAAVHQAQEGQAWGMPNWAHLSIWCFNTLFSHWSYCNRCCSRPRINEAVQYTWGAFIIRLCNIYNDRNLLTQVKVVLMSSL